MNVGYEDTYRLLYFIVQKVATIRKFEVMSHKFNITAVVMYFSY